MVLKRIEFIGRRKYRSRQGLSEFTSLPAIFICYLHIKSRRKGDCKPKIPLLVFLVDGVATPPKLVPDPKLEPATKTDPVGTSRRSKWSPARATQTDVTARPWIKAGGCPGNGEKGKEYKERKGKQVKNKQQQIC
ncbi:hypothetical protein E2C01_052041 [Portunus trituberculatus]|uniref:Uncharacterized protein n=1 Tax=Portunus trituberculatus TaxID=210409 RepID=A0A5B7GM05_PORTR|nr:hypothetical protein [Portunus trituberculatus]